MRQLEYPKRTWLSIRIVKSIIKIPSRKQAIIEMVITAITIGTLYYFNLFPYMKQLFYLILAAIVIDQLITFYTWIRYDRI